MNTQSSKADSTATAPRNTKPAPKRGPKPAFSPTQIALAAIRIADKEGLDAVTMQRVAHALGLTTMALYRYFPGKAELVAIMIDSAGEPSPRFEDSSLPWKERLRAWAHSCAAIYRHHPWFLQATTIRRTLMGPNELSWMEAALKMLTESGLSPASAYNAFFAIIGHVRAHAMFQQIKTQTSSPRKFTRDLSRLLQSEAGKYPALQAVLDSGAFDAHPAQTFDFGLSCILDGISAQTHIGSKRTSRTK